MSTMGENYAGRATCPNCGATIMPGSRHICTSAAWPERRELPPLKPTTDERAALALERIAFILESIAAPPPAEPPADTEPLPLDVEKTRATFAPKP